MPYSEITITAPDSAKAGTTVDFSVGIKNVITTPGIIAWEFRVSCWAPDQMPESQLLDNDRVVIDVGDTKTYPLSFVMPEADAQIFVWVERLLFKGPGEPPEWPYDNSALKDVLLLAFRVGDTCRATVNFDYSGLAISATLYVAIGNYGVAGFDEILHGSKRWSIPETYPAKTYSAYADIYISSAISPGTYDTYAKLMEITGYPDVFSPTYEDIILILAKAGLRRKRIEIAMSLGKKLY